MFDKVTAVAALLCGSECWTVTVQQRQTEVGEMNLLTMAIHYAKERESPSFPECSFAVL
jgi:hypothetical protein